MELNEFTAKHHEFREEVRDFVEKEIKPVATELDARAEFPHELLKKISQKGWMGIPFPEKYGGLGLDNVSYIIALEEMSKVCASTAITLAAHISLACLPIYMKGTEAQKQKYLLPLARGEKLGSFGLTEPNAGSDAGATETTVVEEGNYWVINGTKRFITNSSYADTIVFTASHDRTLKTKGISAFIVEKGTEGCSAGKKEDKLGLRASNTAELHFEDCKIPKENILGQEREGFKVFMETLDGGRISIGVLGLGIAQGALDVGIEYIKTHERNGVPMSKLQWVQETIADLATEIAGARHLVYHAAYLKDKDAKITIEGAMAKLKASEIGTHASRKIIDIVGTEALTSAYPLERFLRDAKLMEIGEGTSQVQKIVISRELLRQM